MKAIVTRYFGPTNKRDAKMKAMAEGGNVIVINYPHESRNAHADAAVKLCEKMKWEGILTEGVLPNGDHVFVFSSESPLEERLKTRYLDGKVTII